MVLVEDVILSDETQEFTENMIQTLKQVFDGSPEIVKDSNKIVKKGDGASNGKSKESFENSTNNDGKSCNLELSDLVVLAVIVMFVTFSSVKLGLDNKLPNYYLIYLFYAFTVTIFFWLYFKMIR